MHKNILKILKLHNRVLNAHSFIPTALNITKAFSPAIVQLELTHRCNLNCAMCYQSKQSDNSNELSAEKWKNLINSLPRWSLITLTGGDPFVRKDFDEILSFALSKNKCNILTNGELMTESQINQMVSGKLMIIGISLDGGANIHNKIRGKKNLFEKVIENIKKIQAEKKKRGSKFPLIDIKTVILKENYNDMESLLKLIDELNVDFWSLSLPKISDTQFGNDYTDNINDIFSAQPLQTCLNLESSAEKSLINQLEKIKNYAGKTVIRFYPYNMLDNVPVSKHIKNSLSPKEFLPCKIPWSFACVSPSGDVFPCLSYKTGNILDTPFKKIWNGKQFRNFRSRLNKKTLNKCCLGCCYSVYKD